MGKSLDEVISKLPTWLQHAAKWLYEYGAPDDEKVSEFADLCKKAANGEPIEAVAHPQLQRLVKVLST